MNKSHTRFPGGERDRVAYKKRDLCLGGSRGNKDFAGRE